MPSLRSKSEEVDDLEPNGAEDTEMFVDLINVMESIKDAFPAEKPIESIVKFTLNGASDAETFERIEQKAADDQDPYGGAKFLIMCLAYGQDATLDAMESSEAMGSREQLDELDEQIRRRRRGEISCARAEGTG